MLSGVANPSYKFCMRKGVIVFLFINLEYVFWLLKKNRLIQTNLAFADDPSFCSGSTSFFHSDLLKTMYPAIYMYILYIFMQLCFLLFFFFVFRFISYKLF